MHNNKVGLGIVMKQNKGSQYAAKTFLDPDLVLQAETPKAIEYILREVTKNCEWFCNDAAKRVEVEAGLTKSIDFCKQTMAKRIEAAKNRKNNKNSSSQ
jgi:hypothetical protein